MKTYIYKILILIIIFFYEFLYSQNFQYVKHVIDNKTNGYSGIYSDDIDNGGDNDIVAPSKADKIFKFI